MRGMSKEQLSKSERIHRRRTLADHRRHDLDIVSRQIIKKIEARNRITEIDRILSPKNPVLRLLAPMEREQTRAILEIEKIWLQFKCGMIKQDEHSQLLQQKFTELENGKPDIYHWLTDMQLDTLSRVQQIRNKVFPPVRIGGFYTKR